MELPLADILFMYLLGMMLGLFAIAGLIVRLVRPDRTPGWTTQHAAITLLQVSICTLVVALLLFPEALGDPPGFAAMAWPTAGPLIALLWFKSHPWTVGPPVVCGGLAAMATVALFARRASAVVMHLIPALATVAFYAALIVCGELRFHLAIRSAAARLAPDCLDAAAWRHMVAIAGDHPQHGLHAEARKGAERYAWSYLANDFYRLSDRVSAGVTATARSWVALPYPHCRRN